MYCTKSDSELSIHLLTLLNVVLSLQLTYPAKKTCTEKIEARFIHPSYNDSKWGAIITAYLSIAQK